MALPPRLYNAKYHISDTILKRQIDAGGVETFRGSGTDYSEQSDNILYVMSYPLERMVALKAFIESVTYNVAKSVDVAEEKDKQDKVISFHEGDLEIDVTLNLPAHSVNEAVNNTAKLEELQRLIMPTSGYRANDFLNFTENMVAPMFFVWFKNIVSSGAYYTDYTKPQNMAVATMKKHGLPCMIDSINYEPDIEMGFFEFNSHRYPKNFKLNLKLTMTQEETKEKEYVIDGFQQGGKYAYGDRGFFPFCVSVGDENDKFNKALSRKTFELSTITMNDLSTRFHGGKSFIDYFFISLDNNKSGDLHNTRYVVLKPFINSFNRENAVNVRYADSKNRVGKIIDADESVTFKNLSYKFNLSVPSEDIAEAKQNCAKVQYLMRMFYRTDSSTSSVYEFSKMYDQWNQNVTENLISRKTRVYSPSFIEGPRPTRTSSSDFQTMFKNSLNLYFTAFSVEVNFEQGFFEDKGRLFPKEMTLNFEFEHDSNDLIKSYDYLEGKYYMQPSQRITDREHLFPYKRKTVKIQ